MPSADGKMTDATIYLEEGIEEKVVEELRALGHNVKQLNG
jgi:gamma-glutamyltranspeptidase/glutathione hydrolase